MGETHRRGALHSVGTWGGEVCGKGVPRPAASPGASACGSRFQQNVGIHRLGDPQSGRVVADQQRVLSAFRGEHL